MLEAFDDYWEGPPGLAGIELYHISESGAVAQALLTDQLDYVGIGSISAENFALFEGNDDFTFLDSTVWRLVGPGHGHHSGSL